jgi:RNase_H superfamily
MNKAKVLLYDLETSPNIAYTWGKWEQNVISFQKEWELLSVAYKWLGTKKVECITRQDFKDTTEKTLVKELWKLLDEADVVVAHNGDAFDNKKAMAKFIQHNLTPPSPYKSIDTKKIAKNRFNFNSNSLGDLGKTLKLGKKLETGGFDLWLKCMAGDKASWKKMTRYNKQDVSLLEKIYLKFRAWTPSHPNLALYSENALGVECPVCSSPHVQKRGFNILRVTKRQRLQCQSCGHWFQGKTMKQELDH